MTRFRNWPIEQQEIGRTSFGGGLSNWLLREFVQDRHWMSEEEFLNGLSLSQASWGSLFRRRYSSSCWLPCLAPLPSIH
ncbi:MAG TPA: chromate transporter [Bordetella sp.]|nr:chromate transporter [Bordetella sp.]